MDHDAIQSWASRVQTVHARERVTCGLFCLFYTCPTFLRSPHTIKSNEDDRAGDAGDGVYSGLDWVAGTASWNPTR